MHLTNSYPRFYQDIGEQEDMGPEFELAPALFGKWSYDSVETNDISLQRYLQVKDIKQRVFVSTF